MAFTNNVNRQRLETVEPSTLTFSLFSSEEIVKLSVLKVTNPITFDSLGHPVSGGLYDPKLGPLDFAGQCTTCFCNVFKCPGHFGHIELPLPVLNPLFTDVVFKLLKITCINCSVITIPNGKKLLFIKKLRLLNKGFIKEAIEFDIASETSKELDEIEYIKATEKLQEDDKNCGNKILQDVTESRSTHVLRESIISRVLEEVGKSCLSCGNKLKRPAIQRKTVVGLEDEKVKGKVRITKSQLTIRDMVTCLRKVYKNESAFLNEFLPVLKACNSEHPTDLFFFHVVPVTPVNVRPSNYVDGRLVENVKNRVYKNIIEDTYVLRNIISLMKNDGSLDDIEGDLKLIIKQIRGTSLVEKLQFTWENLQIHCDSLLDSKSNEYNKEPVGLKQVLEKKEGIIRMNMMGKRVNFAARSVITPDPNLNIDEIGIPEEFAKKLTYPVPVTPWNVKMLRKMVMNGPNVHPGAVFVEMEDGGKIRLPGDNAAHRESIANQLLTPAGRFHGHSKKQGMKILHRHLINGDILLMNRQPTLHKPSIMGHRARVLKGEKTIRMHYSNCKSYNADFDGDEMNAHFPQSELARSEAYNIVSVCNQYLVPKDGTPLGGLIQDHVISGVRLSIRGRFFTRSDYMQLVFQALPYVHGDIKLLPPSIIKPINMWSGKQIISTVIINIIPKGKKLISLQSKSKISEKAWMSNKTSQTQANPKFMSEADVIIRNGELLCGVLDKMHYGATPYSLVHCLYELYGGECSSKLLSALSKLFTSFLQLEGFTLGIRDILLTKEADRKRSKLIKKVRKVGKEAAAISLDLPPDVDDATLNHGLENEYCKNSKFRQVIDRQYKILLDSFTNQINSTCVPNGLIQKFPDNNLQLMVQSGAKGSTVNTMQISSLLGQIELEGKRPPLMVSGRSLPSFPPYDTSAIAGGFVAGRFMTGIRPQEFFYHCMAGREGLIDTAVKTSRSGYLQRCLIKHLEDLSIAYDMTVRTSDGSVVQFQYGEDGLDVTKSQFIKKEQFPFLMENCDVIVNEDALKRIKNENNKDDFIKAHNKSVKSYIKHNNSLNLKSSKVKPFTLFSSSTCDKKSSSKFNRKTGRTSAADKLCKSWINLDEDVKADYYKKCRKRPDPLSCQLQPDRDFGVISEKIDSLINDYLNEREKQGVGYISKKAVRDVMCYKTMLSMCNPGEPVGVLAAQSVGEPSTQMTLNTFHFAGRGDMNVTLGIPRLREILMMASKNIKTPSVDVPFRKNIVGLEKKAEKLRKSLCRITLGEVLEYVTVTERQIVKTSTRKQIYVLHFQLLPNFVYKNNTNLKRRDIIRFIETNFIKNLIKSGASDIAFVYSLDDKDKKKKRSNKEEEEEDLQEEQKVDEPPANLRNNEESSEEEDEIDADGNDDATTAKRRARRQEEHEYQDKEEEDIDKDDKDNILFDELDDEKNVKEEMKSDDEGEDQGVTNEKEMMHRTTEVIDSSDFITDYRFDTEAQMWCEVTLSYPISFDRIDFSVVVRERAKNAVIYEVEGIKRAFTYVADDRLMLKTDGCNFTELFKHHKLLELERLYCNDVIAIANTYGIEAAGRVIVKEVQDVFKVYGITVDPRHLLLIADYMTFDGSVQAMNRTGMDGILSPLQQMSFESSCRFLKKAVLQTKTDRLKSPSSCLITGLPCRSGTGAMDILQSAKAYLSAQQHFDI